MCSCNMIVICHFPIEISTTLQQGCYNLARLKQVCESPLQGAHNLMIIIYKDTQLCKGCTHTRCATFNDDCKVIVK